METFQGQKPAKVEKAAKETKGMFQTLIGASLGPVGAILGFLEQLKPFMAIINIIKGLFSALIGEAMKPLIGVLTPIFDILIGFMPIVRAIGKIIGILISVSLIPLRVVFALLEKLLTPLLPYIEWFADLMGELMVYIDPLIDIIVNVLLVAIGWLWLGISSLVDIIVGSLIFAIKCLWFGIASFINGIISLINLIPGVNIGLIPLPTFQYGGVMPHTGLAWLEKDERVATAYENREMIDLLQEISNYSKRLLNDKEFRHR